MKLPPLPPLWPNRKRKTKSGAKVGTHYGPNDLDRVVMWREGKEMAGEHSHTYGTCARCRVRRQATDLRWVPDRIVFGEWKQGYWVCKGGCE